MRCHDGEPDLSFYRPRERLMIHERKRKEEKEKRDNGGEKGSRAVFLFSPCRRALLGLQRHPCHR
jgi:hypothetical protein